MQQALVVALTVLVTFFSFLTWNLLFSIPFFGKSE